MWDRARKLRVWEMHMVAEDGVGWWQEENPRHRKPLGGSAKLLIVQERGEKGRKEDQES